MAESRKIKKIINKNKSVRAGNDLKEEISRIGLDQIKPKLPQNLEEKHQEENFQDELNKVFNEIFSSTTENCYLNYTLGKGRLSEKIKEKRRKKFQQFRDDFQQRIEKKINNQKITSSNLKEKLIEELSDFIYAKNEPSFLIVLNDSLEKFASLKRRIFRKSENKGENKFPSSGEFWKKWEGNLDGSYYVQGKQKVEIIDYDSEKGEVMIKKTPQEKILKVKYQEFEDLMKDYQLISVIPTEKQEKLIIGKILVDEEGRVVKIGTYKPGERQNLEKGLKSKYIRKEGTVSILGPEEFLENFPRDKKTGGIFLTLEQLEDFINQLEKKGFHEIDKIGDEIERLNSWLKEEKKKLELEKQDVLSKKRKNLEILGQFKFLIKNKNYNGDESNNGRIMIKIREDGKIKYVSAKELKKILKYKNHLKLDEENKEEFETLKGKTEEALTQNKIEKSDLKKEKTDKIEKETKRERNKFDEDKDEDLIIGKLSQKELEDYRRERTRRNQFIFTEDEKELKENVIKEKEQLIKGQKEDTSESEKEKEEKKTEKKVEQQNETEKQEKEEIQTKLNLQLISSEKKEREDYSTEELEKRQQELAAFLMAKPRSGGKILEEESHEKAEFQFEIEKLEKEIEQKKEKYQKALAKFKRARRGTTRFQRALSIFERGREFFGMGESWEGTIWIEKKKAETEMKVARQDLEEVYLQALKKIKKIGQKELEGAIQDKEEAKRALLNFMLSKEIFSSQAPLNSENETDVKFQEKRRITFFEKFNLDMAEVDKKACEEVFNQEKKAILKKILEKYQKLDRKQKIAFSILAAIGVGAGTGVMGGASVAIMAGAVGGGRKILTLILGAGTSTSVDSLFRIIQKKKQQITKQKKEEEFFKGEAEEKRVLDYLNSLLELNEKIKKQEVQRKLIAAGAAFVVGAGAQAFFNDVLNWDAFEKRNQIYSATNVENDVNIKPKGIKTNNFSDLERRNQKSIWWKNEEHDQGIEIVKETGIKTNNLSYLEDQNKEKFNISQKDTTINTEKELTRNWGETEGKIVLSEVFKRGDTVWDKLEKYYNGNQAKVAKTLSRFRKEIIQKMVTEREITPSQAEEYIKWRFRHIYAQKDVEKALDKIAIIKNGNEEKLVFENFDHEKYLRRFSRERGIELKGISK